MKTIQLKAPYLIFLGDETSATYAKTGAGIAQWRPSLCKGQLRLQDDVVDLGLPDMTVQQAVDAGIKSLIVGVAPVGGHIPEQWLNTLVQAAGLGMDIVAGFHSCLKDMPDLCSAAQVSGAQLIDVRVPPETLPVGSGKKRTGRRLLTVGTDCALGKKYSALALEKDMKAAGINVSFRASGQTGIMIAGQGIPIDSVVADFVSGAAELLSPDNSDDHWDVIEGQGSIFHPGYSAVSVGLLVGSQPDAFVVCHEAGRTHIAGWNDFELPSIEQVIERTVTLGRQTNPNIACVGVCVNTSHLDKEKREAYLRDLSTMTGLPCVDPLIDGTATIIDRLNMLYVKYPR